MVGRSQVEAVHDEGDGDGSTVTELATLFKSAFQKADFTRVEEVLMCREANHKKEIEKRDLEIILLKEKLRMEKLKSRKDHAELKELVCRLKEENSEMKRKNCDLQYGKLKAETEVDVRDGRLKVIEAKVAVLEKDWDMLDKMYTNIADKRRPLSKEIVEIVDSDVEAASGNNVSENDPAVLKRALSSSVDIDDSCPFKSSKRLKVQQHVLFTSTIAVRSTAALNSESQFSEKFDCSSKQSHFD